jgi:hypothetical protein
MLWRNVELPTWALYDGRSSTDLRLWVCCAPTSTCRFSRFACHVGARLRPGS